MNYLLDANTYIEAKNRYYDMNFCPGYWSWLDLEFTRGRLGSIEMVSNELKNFGDELSVWVKDRPEHFVSVDDASTQEIFSEIAEHVYSMPLASEPNIANFLAGADPWLIAKAKTLNATVVTHEVFAGTGSKKVKVPNVCKDFGVSYMDTFELLHALDAKLILDR